MAWAAVLLLCASPLPAGALGAVCGTVRDATTSAPVPRAFVLLRTTAGLYTGLHGATDTSGQYCVADVPAGTYDIEVRVDDYRVAYRRNVVVVDAPVDTDLEARLPSMRLDLWPRPARTTVSLRVQIDRAAPLRLEIFDGAGRSVRAWSAAAFRGERVFTWDFRDHDGRPLAAGRYFVRLESGTDRIVRSIVHIP